MLSSEIVVDDTDHKCGFTLLNEWRYIADHYFISRDDAEKFIKELEKSVERVWPCGGY